MQENVLELLNDKIDNLLQKYQQAQKTIEECQTQMENLKSQNEELQLQNAQLQEAIALKDLELEEIVGKIEAILGQ
ncbi:MAG: coiled-coil domain-containing protein 22 [Epsilonproteobacteria bacterium]|nr:coiled-coil domain-containing protein 22 [Campylobacterota bacterium]